MPTWPSGPTSRRRGAAAAPTRGRASPGRTCCARCSSIPTRCALSIKWPNDIYWHDRKLCGILIECQLSGQLIRDCIIGVGLNVNQRQFRSDAPNPVSLRQIIGHDLDRETVLQRILGAFTLTGVDAARYRSLLYRREGLHAYRDKAGEFKATLLTVEPDGHLVLRDELGTTRRYAFKEVQYII